MLRHTASSLALLAILALASACADPTEGKPQARVEAANPSTSAPPAEPAPAAAAERLVLDPASKIHFVGSKVTGSHNGGFESFQGHIDLVSGKPELSGVKVVIDTQSLFVDNEKLTGHLKSPDFFDVERFPQATFTSTRIEPMGDHYMISGNLELHGVTKEITFPATIEIDDQRVSAKSEFAIKRFDFDIVYPGKPDDLIRDDVLIQLDLVAQRSAAADGGARSGG